MKFPARPKLSLRINGTRIGDTARPDAADAAPAATDAPAPARTLRRAVPALVIRDYRDELGIVDDDGVAS